MKPQLYSLVIRTAAVLFLSTVGSLSLSGQIIPAEGPVGPGQLRAPDANVYLVTFEPNTTGAERLSVVQNSGAIVRRIYVNVNVLSVSVPDNAALAGLRNNPAVISVFENRPIGLATPAVRVQRNGRGGGGGGGGGGGDTGSKPQAPSNLAATAVSSSQIDLVWDDNSNDEQGFSLERCSPRRCKNFVEIASLPAGTSAYSDTGLVAETLYRYRVVAFNAAGTSKNSNTAEATTAASAPPEPPTAPSNLSATPGSSQIDLQWTDNSSDEDEFRLERCTGSSCTGFSLLVQVPANVTTYSDSNVIAGQTYTYRVYALNGTGSSGYSNTSEATAPDPGPSTQVLPTGVERIGAHLVDETGAGVGVAIVDTGLDFDHPDLGLNPEIPGVNAFSFFYPTCQDFYGHGTHVGGIVAARNNTFDVVGVAPEATLYCVGVFQDDPIQGPIATDESLVAGLDWIASNADSLTPPIRAVNMSLGRPWTVDDDNPNHPLRAAIRALYDSGISIVVAAGNDPLMEATEAVPAGYPEAIAVASATSITGLNGYGEPFPQCVGVSPIARDTASYFTTDGAFVAGRGVTVSAPGEEREDIFSFDGVCYLEPIGILSTALGGGTEQLYGTSMASPHVAGVVALLWDKHSGEWPALSGVPEIVRERIRATVDRPGTVPLDSPTLDYSFDGEREGVVWVPAAVLDEPPPVQDLEPSVTILSPASGAEFNVGENIGFAATAEDSEDGDLTPAIEWTSSVDGAIGTGGGFSTTSLSSGLHAITASVTDSGENVSNDSVSITVGSPSQPTAAQVTSLVYSEQGTTLSVTIGISDEFGGPLSGVQVSADMIQIVWGWDVFSFSGTTDSQGRVKFSLINAPIDCYVTQVKSVVAPGLTWDGTTPSNSYCL